MQKRPEQQNNGKGKTREMKKILGLSLVAALTASTGGSTYSSEQGPMSVEAAETIELYRQLTETDRQVAQLHVGQTATALCYAIAERDMTEDRLIIKSQGVEWYAPVLSRAGRDDGPIKGNFKEPAAELNTTLPPCHPQ